MLSTIFKEAAFPVILDDIEFGNLASFIVPEFIALPAIAATLNVPKPTKRTSPPDDNSPLIDPNTASTASEACVFEIPAEDAEIGDVGDGVHLCNTKYIH